MPTTPSSLYSLMRPFETLQQLEEKALSMGIREYKKHSDAGLYYAWKNVTALPKHYTSLCIGWGKRQLSDLNALLIDYEKGLRTSNNHKKRKENPNKVKLVTHCHMDGHWKRTASLSRKSLRFANKKKSEHRARFRSRICNRKEDLNAIRSDLERGEYFKHKRFKDYLVRTANIQNLSFSILLHKMDLSCYAVRVDRPDVAFAQNGSVCIWTENPDTELDVTGAVTDWEPRGIGKDVGLEGDEEKLYDEYEGLWRLVSGQMTHFVASSTLDSAISCVMQGAFCTQRKVSMVSFGRISPNRFLSSILLVVLSLSRLLE
ncbi:hypothetical protein Tco_1505428 [Tanacetum coccineum]